MHKLQAIYDNVSYQGISSNMLLLKLISHKNTLIKSDKLLNEIG